MKRRILLVDDDLAVLLSLKAVLELNGFEAHTASSVREAYSQLQSSSYHMVITDMKIDGKESGFAVIEAAQAAAYDPAIAILTAYPDLGQEWSAKGAHCLLIKPVGPRILLRQIEALLTEHADRKRCRQLLESKSSEKAAKFLSCRGAF